MASRYLVTGVQLGILITLPNLDDRKKLLDEIEEKQFVGNSSTEISKDAEQISENIIFGEV